MVVVVNKFQTRSDSQTRQTDRQDTNNPGQQTNGGVEELRLRILDLFPPTCTLALAQVSKWVSVNRVESGNGRRHKEIAWLATTHSRYYGYM